MPGSAAHRKRGAGLGRVERKSDQPACAVPRPAAGAPGDGHGFDAASAQATARLSAHCDQSWPSAEISRSMSASVCTGEGVMRSRSVPFGTVG